MERPSAALFFAFCLAQLVSSIIAAYGDWGFTQIAAVEGGWIGIVWVWVSSSLICLASNYLLTIITPRISAGSYQWISSSSR